MFYKEKLGKSVAGILGAGLIQKALGQDVPVQDNLLNTISRNLKNMISFVMPSYYSDVEEWITDMEQQGAIIESVQVDYEKHTSISVTWL